VLVVPADPDITSHHRRTALPPVMLIEPWILVLQSLEDMQDHLLAQSEMAKKVEDERPGDGPRTRGAFHAKCRSRVLVAVLRGYSKPAHDTLKTFLPKRNWLFILDRSRCLHSPSPFAHPVGRFQRVA